MKDDFVRVRLTCLEKAALKSNAKKLGMSMSDYVKYCCLINLPKQYDDIIEEERIVNEQK